MNYKAVIFDMDGILLDTESICDRTWTMAADQFHLDPEKAAKAITLCRGTNKNGTRAVIKQSFGQDFDVDTFLAKTSELFYYIEETEGIKLMPHVIEALDYIKNKGYKMALASSTRQTSVIRQLTNAGLISYFETITTGDMVEHGKPDPEIYLKACKSIGLDPKDCIAIEDSPNGLRSAKSAGLSTIMIPDLIPYTDDLKPIADTVIDSFNEIYSLL